MSCLNKLIDLIKDVLITIIIALYYITVLCVGMILLIIVGVFAIIIVTSETIMGMINNIKERVKY